MISIIVQTYNSRETLAKLLRSIEESMFTDYEVLVVDDGSTDGTLEMLQGDLVRVLKTPRNGGPSLARNVGARVAGGDVILFLDSDVILRPDTLDEVERFFRYYPDRSVMIGVYDPEPANPGAWPLYKALQCYSYYWRFPPIREVSLLWAAVAAFRKDVYLQSGGFDVGFNGPSMEDLELGRRISLSNSIFLNRRVVVKHHFPPTLRKNVRDHFHRGYLWVKIYFKHHRFDNYLSTPRRALGRLTAFAVIPSLLLTPFFPAAGWAAAVYFTIYLLCNYDLWAVVGKRAPRFLATALLMDYLLGVVLGAAFVSAVIEEVYRRVRNLIRDSKRLGALLPSNPDERSVLAKTVESAADNEIHSS